MAPLVVQRRCLVFPVLPGSRHGSESVNAFTQSGVECLIKAIDESYIAKLRSGAMDFELTNEFFYRVVTLASSS